jgi:protein Tex
MLQEPNYIQEIAEELQLKNTQIETVLWLIAEWATVPFIARYRTEHTGWLDENDIRAIIDLQSKIEKLFKAKQTAINGITELDAMTPELMDNILKARTLKEVEEIYKPYKSKKKTKAMLAIEKGFQVVADSIKQNTSFKLPDNLLSEYSEEEILQWAEDIIAAEVSANADLRADLIDTLEQHWIITSKFKTEKTLEKLNEKDKEQITKFDIYKEFSGRLQYLKPYQVLALNRWEKLGILAVKIEKNERTYEWISYHYARILWVRLPFITELEAAFKSWYDTLFKSVENEVRWVLSELGEDDAIDTFKTNLAALLMTQPQYGKTVLAIDPGFRAGCKIAVLDDWGNPIHFNKIFLHSLDSATATLKKILTNYDIDIIAVWNGTWVNETTELLHDITKKDIFIVNESGASVYSASKVAQEEFPDLDTLDRGTVSIGRRYIDPLSELVKIPVGSIGVGMYQHDIPEKKLEEKLWFVVEDTVNKVGININTASSYVLEYISGINKTSAKKIYKNRPYSSRADLKKQLSPKTYEQAAGFLRVPESEESYDNTDIHPEQYGLARYIEKSSPTPSSLDSYFSEHKSEILKLYPDATTETLSFIIQSLEESGKEKRIHSTHKKSTAKWSVDYKQWDIVEWVIRNVVAFWAFVDIGMKNDGLVHVSQIADKFISDPKEEVEVGQTVRVKITWIDDTTWKIQLSMKEV